MAILAAIVLVSCRGEDRMTRQEFLDAGNRVCVERSCPAPSSLPTTSSVEKGPQGQGALTHMIGPPSRMG